MSTLFACVEVDNRVVLTESWCLLQILWTTKTPLMQNWLGVILLAKDLNTLPSRTSLQDKFFIQLMALILISSIHISTLATFQNLLHQAHLEILWQSCWSCKMRKTIHPISNWNTIFLTNSTKLRNLPSAMIWNQLRNCFPSQDSSFSTSQMINLLQMPWMQCTWHTETSVLQKSCSQNQNKWH